MKQSQAIIVFILFIMNHFHLVVQDERDRKNVESEKYIPGKFFWYLREVLAFILTGEILKQLEIELTARKYTFFPRLNMS